MIADIPNFVNVLESTTGKPPYSRVSRAEDAAVMDVFNYQEDLTEESRTYRDIPSLPDVM